MLAFPETETGIKLIVDRGENEINITGEVPPANGVTKNKIDCKSRSLFWAPKKSLKRQIQVQ